MSRSNLYNEWLQSAEDAFGYPLDIVTIVHAGLVVSETLANGLATARPPYLGEFYHVHSQPTEPIR